MDLLNIQVQHYNSAKDNVGKPWPVNEVIKAITGVWGKDFQPRKLYEKYISQLQKDSESEATKKARKLYDDAKKELPGVTWSGTFAKATTIKADYIKDFISGKITWNDLKNIKNSVAIRTRAAEQIVEHSGLICLDFDKVENINQLKSSLIKWPYTFILFVSPSGVGIKLIVKINPDTATHKNAFIELQELIKINFNQDIDKSGKDVSRLCFLCPDPEIYVNPDAARYEIFGEAPAPVPAPKKISKTKAEPTTEDLYSVIYFTDKFSTYHSGNRNNYIHLFACNANRKGFSLDETLNFSIGHFTDGDLTANEISATVKSAYQNNSNEHGKFAKKSNTSSISGRTFKNNESDLEAKKIQGENAATTKGKSGKGNSDKNLQDVEAYTQFWREKKKVTGKGKSRKVESTFTLNRTDLTDFLFEQGFHSIDTSKGGFQLCFSRNGIIKPVDPRTIKMHVIDWCRKMNLREIQEMLRTGQTKYFSMAEMDALHVKNVEFKRDTADESYFYFKNCWVTVSADAITPRPYNELTGHIWEGNKKDHEFEFVNMDLNTPEDQRLTETDMKCEFAKFVLLASWNPNGEEKDFTAEQVDQRFLSFCSAIGYLLDGYKHPANRKGIFALDHKVGDKNEKNGRSGKSMIPKACSFLKVSCTINGKTFDPRYPFRYEPITADAQIVNFNDMRQNFDVEEIFEVIADDYSVLRRNNGYIDFQYEVSPKVYYSANGVPKGDGGSYKARMQFIEFSDYFNPEHTPYDEFGHGFFDSSWNAEEWNRFYNFLLWCVSIHKKDGLIEYPESNFTARKMAIEVIQEFIDFMDSDAVKRDVRIKKMDLLEEYNKIHQALYGAKLKPHSLAKWIRLFCKNRGLYFNPHKNGNYDKSNGIEYYTIATKEDFKPAEIGIQDMFNK